MLCPDRPLVLFSYHARLQNAAKANNSYYTLRFIQITVGDIIG